MEFSFELIAWLLTAGLAIVAAVFKVKYRNVLKELFDVFKALEHALEDDKITKEELQNIVKEAKEAMEAIKGLVKK